MIKLLYFSYALHKQKVLKSYPIFYFRFDKKFSRGRCESSVRFGFSSTTEHTITQLSSGHVKLWLVLLKGTCKKLFVLYFRITIF